MYFNLHSGKKIFIQNKSFQFIFVVFLISLGLGIFDAIFSLYLENILKDPSLVGFVSAIITMIMFFTYLFLTQMYSKYPVTHVWLVSTLLMGFCLFLLYFFSQIVIFTILIGLVVISMTLHFNTTAIILRHSSTLENIGKIQGYYYTFRNIGWVIGPLISSFILYKFGLLNNFLAIGLFIFSGWLLFLYYQIKAYEENKPQTISLKSIRQNIVDYFRNKELFKLYFLRGALSLYWSVFYIFTPLYILYNGLSISFVGIFLGVATIPVVIIEYFIAKKIDVILKRELFITGSFLISLFLVLAFVFNGYIYLSLIFILLSIIGAGFLEPTCETYFFNNVNQFIADRYYGVYRTSDSLFSLTSRLFFGFILLFLKIKFIYLFTGIFFILIYFISKNIKN
jgi:MFS family permease